MILRGKHCRRPIADGSCRSLGALQWTRLLKCFVLMTLCCKTKRLRSLIGGVVRGFEWVEILGLSQVNSHQSFTVMSIYTNIFMCTILLQTPQPVSTYVVNILHVWDSYIYTEWWQLYPTLFSSSFFITTMYVWQYYRSTTTYPNVLLCACRFLWIQSLQ